MQHAETKREQMTNATSKVGWRYECARQVRFKCLSSVFRQSCEVLLGLKPGVRSLRCDQASRSTAAGTAATAVVPRYMLCARQGAGGSAGRKSWNAGQVSHGRQVFRGAVLLISHQPLEISLRRRKQNSRQQLVIQEGGRGQRDAR
jgi:hypothetical protein